MSDAPVVVAPVVPVVETVAEVKKPVTDGFASKFAALSRKEQEFKAREATRESEYAAKQAEIAEKQKKYSSYETLDADLASDKRKALEFLKSKGISPEDLNELLVQEFNPNEEEKFKRMQSQSEKTLRKEIEELKLQFEERETKKKESEESSAKEQHEKVVQKVMGDLTEFVNKDENYELIRNYDSVGMVFEVIQQHYDAQVKAGTPEQMVKILTYKEACDAVEGHLEEQVSKAYEAKRARQSPKNPEQDIKKTSQTLSNTLASEVPVNGDKQLSNEDSLKNAAKMLRFFQG